MAAAVAAAVAGGLGLVKQSTLLFLFTVVLPV